MLIVVLCACAVLVVTSGNSSSRGKSVQDGSLSDRVQTLQEELKKKDVALAVLEKRLREAQDLPSPAAFPGKGEPSAKSGIREGESASQDESPLTALEESLKPRSPGQRQSTPQEESESSQGPLTGESRLTESVGSAAPSPETEVKEQPTKKPINFNAEAVTASTQGPNGGTLSFRLVKDQPDIRFSGYLFVFVEIGDPRGENKIYVYPNTAPLGEEDLPTDYKKGESLSFKFNSRVELPYEDIRSGAAISRVSILLYGESGRIVFQRSFERKEVKIQGAKSTHADGSGPRQKAGEKRRAL
ncbi:MAG TPA: hypothetical protein VK463_17510 [Desulfomonilaceae bacterium]|nr:hypothetical protein [Desulfomonilaceae bacterium]